MTTPAATRSPSRQKPSAGAWKDDAVQNVFRGGWFIVEDVNGELVVVRLPARVEVGA
jgi:hypothetical protein